MRFRKISNFKFQRPKGRKLCLISNSKAFTLIELLVVIAIIAILAAIAMVAFGIVSRNGRDAKRLTDLRIIQGALEQYYADQGVYPLDINGELAGGCALKSDQGAQIDGCTSASNNTSTTKTYYNKLPKDPSGGSYTYQSFETRTGTECSTANECISYCLYTTMEGTTQTASDNQTNEIESDLCGSSDTFNFAISQF